MTNSSKYIVTKNESVDEQNPAVVNNSQTTTNRGKEDQKRRKSRIFRLCTMLVAIVVFCIVELVIGHLAHSLALVADSFHMMSDALSLIIAAVAIRMGGKINKEKNTFGWLRAEILGAVINGVFLLALCLTISLHACERLLSPEPVEQPMMVLIVGGIGLLVNVFGMFLFHEHSHTHSHSHKHDAPSAKHDEPDGSHKHSKRRTKSVSEIQNRNLTRNKSFTVETPDLSFGRRDHGGLKAASGSISDMSSIRRKINFIVHEELCNSICSMDNLESPVGEELSEVFVLEKRGAGGVGIAGQYIEEEKESTSSGEIHSNKGAASRNASNIDSETVTSTPTDSDQTNQSSNKDLECQPFLRNGRKHSASFNDAHCGSKKPNQKISVNSHQHHNDSHHNHNHHGDENNMRAVFLHILSDLFASVLVILTASAYILMEKYGQKYGGKDATWLMYIDPVLSLVIVIIIVVPTYKLIRQSAQILLNNAPGKISPHQFAKELSRHIPEVTSVHDLYLWHLTADIIVATTHVVVKSNEKQTGSQLDFEQRFMELSNKLNSFFHGYGITTTTIQVEFADPNGHANECCMRCSGVKEVTGVSNSGRKVSMNVKL